MAKKKKIVRMRSSESPHTYTTTNSKAGTKLEVKKFDPTPGVRRHVVYNETKLK
jgi:large subunit ribosomal protein L33